MVRGDRNMATTAHHKVVIVGGGSAGISVAARLNKKVGDVAVIDPSEKHYYQPLWTLVGGGCSKRETSERSEASVIPKGVTWIKDAVTTFDPDNNTVATAQDKTIGYDVLVVCPGIQLDWDKIPGVTDTLGKNGVSSNYTYDLAPKTWDFIRGGMFGVKVFSDALDKVVADYGINVHFKSELESVDADSKKATFKSLDEGGDGFTLDYDMMHVVPHQSAPDWVKSSPLSTDAPTGYVDVDKHTHQHVRYPNIFSLGDAGSTPNSKTGAAIRKQAPVVAANVISQLAGQTSTEKYGGYASCPLTTSSSEMLLAEFDYTMEHTPSFPIINLQKPRRDMWYLKKNGLPFMYWNLMLKGKA